MNDSKNETTEKHHKANRTLRVNNKNKKKKNQKNLVQENPEQGFFVEKA